MLYALKIIRKKEVMKISADQYKGVTLEATEGKCNNKETMNRSADRISKITTETSTNISKTP